MSEELKYEFNLDDPDSWSNMPKPYMAPEFIAETNKIGGYIGDKPRFRWVWGMEEEVYVDMSGTAIASGWYLKYHLCDKPPKVVGFTFMGDDGKERFVADQASVPVGRRAIPRIKPEQIGYPRWVLEEWRQAGDQNGTFDRDGYYFHRWIVQDDQPENPETMLKPYREPNYNDLEILRGYVKATATLTDADIRQGVAAARRT